MTFGEINKLISEPVNMQSCLLTEKQNMQTTSTNFLTEIPFFVR
jgi:hypothetical protein